MGLCFPVSCKNFDHAGGERLALRCRVLGAAHGGFVFRQGGGGGFVDGGGGQNTRTHLRDLQGTQRGGVGRCVPRCDQPQRFGQRALAAAAREESDLTTEEYNLTGLLNYPVLARTGWITLNADADARLNGRPVFDFGPAGSGRWLAFRDAVDTVRAASFFYFNHFFILPN